MSVSNIISKDGPYVGNASTTNPYPYAFVALDDADVKVLMQTTVSDEGVELTPGQYTVTRDDDNVGGIIRTAVAYASTVRITIFREMEYDQQSVFQRTGKFPSDSVETGLDRLTLQMQQLLEVTERCLRLPVNNTGTEMGIAGLTDAVAGLKAGVLAFRSDVDLAADLMIATDPAMSAAILAKVDKYTQSEPAGAMMVSAAAQAIEEDQSGWRIDPSTGRMTTAGDIDLIGSDIIGAGVSAKRKTIVTMFGQSNVTSHQTAFNSGELTARGLSDRASYHTSSWQPGVKLDGWVGGTSPAYTRGAAYDLDFWDGVGGGAVEERVAGYEAASVDLVLVMFQGEADSVVLADANLYESRLTWLMSQIVADIPEIRRMRVVFCLPETTGGTYMATVHAAIAAVIALDPTNRKSIPTIGYPRTVDGVHLDDDSRHLLAHDLGEELQSYILS